MDLNIHVPTGTLLLDRKSKNQLAEAKISQKNGFVVNVWFLNDGPDVSTPLVVAPIPAPYTRIVISARPNDDLDNPLLLFFLDEFEEVGEGDELHYEGLLNSATSDIADLFTSPSKTRAPALMDVDLLVSADPEDGHKTVVKQRDIFIYRAIWQGNEGVDPDAVPAYPLPGEIERVSRKGTAGGYASLDEDGKVPADQLPDLSKDIRVTVADEAALLDLAIEDVQNGDVVAQTSPAMLYQVTNDAVLGTLGAFTALATVPWTAVTGKPSTFAPTAHTHPAGEITGNLSASRWVENRITADHTGWKVGDLILEKDGGRYLVRDTAHLDSPRLGYVVVKYPRIPPLPTGAIRSAVLAAWTLSGDGQDVSGNEFHLSPGSTTPDYIEEFGMAALSCAREPLKSSTGSFFSGGGVSLPNGQHSFFYLAAIFPEPPAFGQGGHSINGGGPCP